MSDDNNNEQSSDATDAALFEEFAQLLDEDGNLKATSTDNEEPEGAVNDPATLQSTEDGDKPEEFAEPQVERTVFDGLPPDQAQAVAELQANYARVQHSENSNRHRVSALTKKLNALEQAQQEAQTVQATAPATEGGEDAQPTTAVDLVQFEEDFPEVFAAMKAMNAQEIAPMRQQLNDVTPTIDSINEDREQQVLQAQFNALQSQHPDYRQIQENPDFWGWVEGQSEGVKQLVGSRSADDNIVLLDLYKRSIPPATVNNDATPARPREGDADEGLPRAGVGRLNGSPDDGDSWEYWAEQANNNNI
jgi:hypothetical protein